MLKYKYTQLIVNKNVIASTWLFLATISLASTWLFSPNQPYIHVVVSPPQSALHQRGCFSPQSAYLHTMVFLSPSLLLGVKWVGDPFFWLMLSYSAVIPLSHLNLSLSFSYFFIFHHDISLWWLCLRSLVCFSSSLTTTLSYISRM